MKKIITISLTLFGIIFLAGCSLPQVSKTQPTTPAAEAQQQDKPVVADETANWLTYTNPTFGYSIKYPTTWTEKQNEQSGRSNVAIEFNNGDSLMLRIVTYKISDREAFVGFLTNGQYKGDSNLLSIISGGTDKNNTDPNIIAYKIGNLDGYRKLASSTWVAPGVLLNGSNSSTMSVLYMTKDSKYIYSLETKYDSKNVESAEIAKMLKTFTTKKTDETANWKTYTNDKYGYEIKYPSDTFRNPVSRGPISSSPEVIISTLGLTGNPGTGAIIGADIIINVYDLNNGRRFLTETGFMGLNYSEKFRENTTFLGFPATKYQGTSVDSFKGIVFTANDKIINIYTRFTKDDNSLSKAFDDILSTFKLIN